MKYKKTTILVSILFMISVIYPLKYIGNEFFAHNDNNLISIKIKMIQGTALEKTTQVVSEVEGILKDIPEAAHYLSNVGNNGTENAQITVILTKKEKRVRSDKDIINYLIPKLAKIPDSEFSLSSQGGAGDDMGGGDVSINIYGQNYNDMVELSKKFIQIMDNSGNFSSISSTHVEPKKEIQFIPDTNKMIKHGVKNVAVGSAIRIAVNGTDTNIYRELGEEYKINVTLDDKFKGSLSDIEQVSVFASGGLIPIKALGKIEVANSLPPMNRRDKQRYIQVNGFLSKSTSGQVQAYLDKEIAKMGVPEGMSYKYVGQAEFMEETQKEIGKAFILAVILTYMLLVAVLNSFAHPFTIVTSVVASTVGALLLLFYFEFSINIGSMMAVVMLVGLVVNNAILMLDQTMTRMREGVPLYEAIWQGAEQKFRAILMTSIAIVAGAFPQLLDPFMVKAAMGGVIIGGMIASIIFTLLVIPAVFYYVEKLKGLFFRV